MEQLTHWKKQFNYDYLGSYSLPNGSDVILTIKETKKEKVTGANGKKEECFVAYFSEKADWIKPMILNRTNCKTIAKIYNCPYIEQWHGKKIQIFIDKVSAFGETTEALRIRPFEPKIEKPILNEAHKAWESVCNAIITGSHTIEKIETKYQLSEEIKTKLKGLK